MDDLVVIGGGGHAKVIVSVLKKIGRYNLLGYTDMSDRGELLGLRFLGRDDILPGFIRKRPHCVAALGVGMVEIDNRRSELMGHLVSLGFNLPAIISPDATVNEGVSLGEGTVVIDGAIVNSGTTIGIGVILNTKCSVDHDCRIGDFVHLGPGVTLSGEVRIGNNSFLGTGTSVIHGIAICARCMIGAGSVVVKDLSSSGKYLGNPAKVKVRID